jgi:hypothetical protein
MEFHYKTATWKWVMKRLPFENTNEKTKTRNGNYNIWQSAQWISRAQFNKCNDSTNPLGILIPRYEHSFIYNEKQDCINI